MGNGGDVPSHRNARRRPASGQALALGGAQAPAWRSKGNAAGRRRPGAGGTPRSHGEGKASRDAGPWRGGGRLSRRRRGLRPVHRQRLDPVGDALSGLAQLLDRPVGRAALGDVARPQILAEARDVIRRRRRFLRDRLMGASSWRRYRRAMVRSGLSAGVPEGPRPGTPSRHLRHNRTPPRGGQRVMRHFLPQAPILRCPAPAAFAIAPLALRMLVTAPAAVLVAPPGKALRVPPRLLATAPGAVDVAVVAAPAENNLTMTGGAVEQAGGVLHRDR